jgi:unsaturated chondroitin disaccharide hydrolase
MNIKLNRVFCYLFLPFLFGGFNNAIAQKRHQLKSNSGLLKTVDSSLTKAVKQYQFLKESLTPAQLPRTFENGKLLTSTPYAWTSGFYPGSMLYLYEYTKDKALLQEANERLKQLEKIKTVTANHDLGFMMYCSYGNAYRLFNHDFDKEVLIQSAKSLASRFYPKVGCIKSWNQVKSLDGKRTLTFPVIIDNMMNLELLFFASKVTGNPYYKNIAITHSETTLKNHFRSDYSSYHVVDYDAETGAIKSKETHQGFSDNSTWSRGQAWAIYGYTMVYRETGDQKYLKAVQKMADFYLNHPNLPTDKIPYWDFNVNQPGFSPTWQYDPNKYPIVPRDASAAAIVSSALIELAGYVDQKSGQKYIRAAEKMLKSLSSPKYTAAEKTNGGFILMHASGGVPVNAEVDVPLSYADYYYIEALMRYRTLAIKK